MDNNTLNDNATSSPGIKGSVASRDVIPIKFQVIIGIIGVVTIFANSALIGVLFKQRHMLKKPYNLVILNLAVVDILTGIFMFVTPGVIISHIHYPSYMTKSSVFCHLVTSDYLLVLLAKLSIALVTFLAFNRWLSVIHPFRYRIYFSRKHAILYLAIIWVVLMVVSLRSPLAMKYSEGRCYRIKGWPSRSIFTVWIIVYVVLTYLIPIILTWLMFAHIYYFLGRTRNSFGGASALTKKSKPFLRMCVVTALLATISWAPAEIFMVIEATGMVDLPHKERKAVFEITKCIGFFNSCVNPFIYCLTNRAYRDEFAKVFKTIFCRWIKSITITESTKRTRTSV